MPLRLFVSVVVMWSLSEPSFGQVLTANPLDQMKAIVEQVLDRAGVPFSEQQDRELALVMEEQRQASERLFGDIMNFSNGPVRGADRERALDGIQWMNDAFEAKLTEVLTSEQNRVWAEFRAAELRSQGSFPALRLALRERGTPLDPAQERKAATIYETAAERLRRAEEGGIDAARAAAIEGEALGQVADLLTMPQSEVLVTATTEASAPQGDQGDPPLPDPDAESVASRRQLVVSALRILAPPTSGFFGTVGSVAGGSSDQIAQIRINNNAFTTENFGGRGGGPSFGGGGPGFGGGGGGRGGPGGGGRGGPGGAIEVIQRGGTGDYHGNFSFDFRDESLTARNAFVDDKPPFQQRNINANISGPFVRNRLTANLTFNQNEQENADTVVATTPDSAVAFGIVRPEVSRTYSGNGQLQIAERHSLHFNVRYQNRHSENNGVGRFTLPERAWTSTGRDLNLGLREIWAITPRTIHEVALNHFGNDNANQAVTRAVRIDVLDAFSSGGADRNNRRSNRNYTLTNMFWYEGDRLTFKTGTESNYRTASSFSEDGFIGQFEFSSLEDYRAGRPLTYSVTVGDPLLDTSQVEIGAFVQTDWRINRRFTFFAGVRYERQTNLDDNDGLDPRMGFAYSLGTSTVVRGGAGLFHQNLNLNLVQDVMRLNGTRQFEIVVSDPTYPDPFGSGTAEVIFPSSRRVFAPDLSIPYEARASLSVERTLPWNISVNGSYDFNRGINRFRTRNLNAPRPGETERPNPTEGNLLQLESAAGSRSHSLRIALRQRLRLLTYSASYTLSSDDDDGEGPFWQPMNNYDPQADWGRAGFNQKHRYNFTINSQAPFGTLFTVDGFGHSGNPYNITTGEDDNGDQATSDRPPGVPRNSGNGPRFFNVNMTLSKTFRLGRAGNGESGSGGGALLSVYANVNNAFNIVNLRNPSGVLTSKYFGIPTSASAARDVEIGMRYQF